MTSPLINVDFKKATPASNILKILIKACIIPLKINRAEKTTSVTFRLRSKQILIFWLYQLIIYGTALFMMFYMTGIKPIMTWFITKFYNCRYYYLSSKKSYAYVEVLPHTFNKSVRVWR